MDEKEKELLETMEQEQADVELPKARIALCDGDRCHFVRRKRIGIVAAGLL